MLDPNPDPELGHFLTFFHSNSNSESSCYIVLDPNPDPNLDSELRRFLTFYSPNSNSESGRNGIITALVRVQPKDNLLLRQTPKLGKIG